MRVIDFTCEGVVADFDIRKLGYFLVDLRDLSAKLSNMANDENLRFLDFRVDPQNCSNRKRTCLA